MKRHFVFPILFCSIFLSTQFANAQSSIPVDPYTGRASISLPVWNMTEGDLSIPISIYHQGGGVRVEQGEGSAGLSWNLSAGGSVSRELRGLPDDYLGTGTDLRKGWLYNSNASAIQNFTSASDDNTTLCDAGEVTDYNFMNGLYNGFNDSEPDIFNFSAPGLTGQFVFGADGLPKLIPYQDLKLEITRLNGNGPIEQIVITNNVGVKYTFMVKETTRKHAYKATPTTTVTHFQREFKNYEVPLTYNSSWHLSSISSPGGAQITLGYTVAEMGDSPRAVSVINTSGTLTDLYFVSHQVSFRQVSGISTDGAVADFYWEENRIGRIAISQSGYSKQFDFVYQDVRDNLDNAPYPASRSFLLEIRQVENCVTYPSYKFTYQGLSGYSIGLPFKSKMFQDLFGYYNGTSATKIPDIHVYLTQTNAERFRLKVIPGQTPSNSLSGAARDVNADVIATGSLSKIYYPSGSFAEIEYEPNQYYDGVADTSYAGGGIRVKRVKQTGAEKGSESIITDYEYLGTDGQTSGRLRYRPVFAFYDETGIIRTPDNLAPEGGLYYLRTTVKQTSKGKTVYEFLAPNLYPAIALSDWNATKSKAVRGTTSPCNGIGSQINGYYQFPFAPNTNYDFERGLLDKVSDFDEAGTLVQEKLYNYIRLTTSSVVIKGIAYDKFPLNYVFGQYTILANLNKVTQIETVRRADEITPANKFETVTTYKYNPTHNLLDSLLVTNSDGVIHKTKYRYAKDFVITNPNTSNIETVGLKGLNDNYRHGELIESIQYRKEGAVQQMISASLTLYKDFGSNKILPQRSLTFPATSGFTTALVTGSPQTFTYAGSYITTNTIQSYNSLGMPLSMLDYRKNKSGIHYGYGDTPLASLSNAYAEEAIYDGFESAGLTSPVQYPVGANIVPGWTGNNAVSIISSQKLTTNTIQKGLGTYRFACWAKASTGPIITFKAMNGTTAQATGTVTYNSGQANQWQYLEAILTMTGVSNLFTLEVSTSATVELDEIRFYPTGSTISTTSIKPLVGVIAKTDDRGVSAFQEYDEWGRLRYIKNKDKHIVQIHDYQYKTEIFTPLNSEFGDDTGGYLKSAGQSISFTSPTNCGLVTYEWKVNGQIVSTAANYGQTFSTPGGYRVMLTVASTAGSVQTTRDYCIKPAPQITLTRTGAVEISHCEPSPTRTVTASLSHATTSNVDYAWYYKLASQNNYTLFPYPHSGITISPDGKVLTFDLSVVGLQSITIKCTVIGNAIISNSNDCDGTYEFTDEETIGFTYITTGNCL